MKYLLSFMAGSAFLAGLAGFGGALAWATIKMTGDLEEGI